ncbi:hypothetical protein ACV566_07730 [Staphylococcus aureus]
MNFTTEVQILETGIKDDEIYSRLLSRLIMGSLGGAGVGKTVLIQDH